MFSGTCRYGQAPRARSGWWAAPATLATVFSTSAAAAAAPAVGGARRPDSPAQGAGASEAAALAGRGVGEDDEVPPYRLMRADEDYRYLRDPATASAPPSRSS